MEAVVAFQRTGTGSTSWTVPSDSILTALAQTGTALISLDPNDTIANVFTPVSNRITDSILIASNQSGIRGDLNIPLLKDQVILVSFSAAGTIILYLNDPLTGQLR